MTKKEKLEDTDLEYYGLTDKGIEEIKNEKTYSSDEADKLLYIRDLFAEQGIYIDDFDKFEKIVEGLKVYDEITNV